VLVQYVLIPITTKQP